MLNVIEVIEAKLQEQKDEIFFKDLEIKDLKNKLTIAEAEIKHLENIIAEDVTKGATE